MRVCRRRVQAGAARATLWTHLTACLAESIACLALSASESSCGRGGGGGQGGRGTAGAANNGQRPPALASAPADPATAAARHCAGQRGLGTPHRCGAHDQGRHAVQPVAGQAGAAVERRRGHWPREGDTGSLHAGWWRQCVCWMVGTGRKRQGTGRSKPQSRRRAVLAGAAWGGRRLCSTFFPRSLQPAPSCSSRVQGPRRAQQPQT